MFGISDQLLQMEKITPPNSILETVLFFYTDVTPEIKQLLNDCGMKLIIEESELDEVMPLDIFKNMYPIGKHRPKFKVNFHSNI